jgi:hypothetical protein
MFLLYYFSKSFFVGLNFLQKKKFANFQKKSSFKQSYHALNRESGGEQK